MEDRKEGEEGDSIVSVVVYSSLLNNTEKLLPGFSIKCHQSPTRKETRKGKSSAFSLKITCEFELILLTAAVVLTESFVVVFKLFKRL